MKNIISYDNFTPESSDPLQEGWKDAGYGYKRYQPPGMLQTMKRKTKSLFGIESSKDRERESSLSRLYLQRQRHQWRISGFNLPSGT
jgi:hypothetical protein